MPDQSVQTKSPPTAPVAQNEPTNQPEATLQDVLDTMHDSDFFPRSAKDAPSRFWSVYERVAKQHDDEFIERHNGEMDVLLIFAGLFSAVSSAFIVNMQSSLSPSASDTTNALLKILVNKIDNTTFPVQEATLPVWTGPSSTTIWIQTLAYTSLSSSLLAAFGAVLGKQWLGHFKTSRFGRGALHERCQRRQQKLDSLEIWHFSMILATLPIFLQLSLFFFGIALAANIWLLQHTVASVIIATTAFGLIFYLFTVVSSLKSPDCPFQTPVSTVLQYIFQEMAPFRKVIRKQWDERPKTWEGFVDGLRESLTSALYTAHNLIAKLIMSFVMYLSQTPPTPRQTRSLANDQGARGSEQHWAARGTFPVVVKGTVLLELESSSLESHAELAQVHAIQSSAVQWILETSTDIDNIAAAAGMVPEIQWPAEDDVANVLDRLKSHFYACFDPTRQILPLAHARAVACMKAICHFYVERDWLNLFSIYPDGHIYSRHEHQMYHLLPDQAYLIVRCAVDDPVELDIISLPLSDRLWMAHMFTHRLRKGDPGQTIVSFAIDFITICLDPKSPARLLADCLLLAGMLTGMEVNSRHLAGLDKSKSIDKLRASVMNHMLSVLIGDIPGRRETALKLVHPLLQDYVKTAVIFKDRRLFDRALKFWFRLLEEDLGTASQDDVRSKSLAILIGLIARSGFWDPKDWCTARQFDLLVDYHLQVCEGTDYNLIRDTFELLEGLPGSPSTPDRMRRYIDTMIRFMGKKITRDEALRAALSVRSVVASMGRDNKSLRERFSAALAKAILLDVAHAPLDDSPFKEISFFSWFPDMAYLRLLRTLCRELAWHPQLHQNGHFNNCLAIADILTSERTARFDDYAVYVANIFAIVDASGEHPDFNAVQMYPSWPLILRAWHYIFHLKFFEEATEDSWKWLSDNAYLKSLPSLVAYARKRGDSRKETLINLVEQVCHELDERQQGRQDDAQSIIVQDRSSRYRNLPDLGKQIRELLDASWKHVAR